MAWLHGFRLSVCIDGNSGREYRDKREGFEYGWPVPEMTASHFFVARSSLRKDQVPSFTLSIQDFAFGLCFVLMLPAAISSNFVVAVPSGAR